MVTSASQLTPLEILINGRSVATVGALPASGDFDGERIFVTGTKETAVWDGTTWTGVWRSFTPSWTNVTLGTTGLVNTGRYRIDGKAITIVVELALGSGGSFTGGPALAMPAGITLAGSSFLPLGVTFMMDGGSAATRRVGQAYRSSTTAVQFLMADNAAGSQTVTASVPWTWAPTDQLSMIINDAELA